MNALYTIRCGSHVIGHVQVTTIDMWHLSGPFEPGKDYSRYEAAIEAVRSLQVAAENDVEADWLDALEVVNDFELVAVTPNGEAEPIRDFQVDSDSNATFKRDV